MDQPFVGRQEELRALLAAIDRPGGQVLLVCGDPGTGKSALIAELHRRLNAAPAPVRRYSLLYRPAETDTVTATLAEIMEALLHIGDLTRSRLVWGVPGDRDRWQQFLKAIPAVGSLLASLVQDDRRPIRLRFVDTLAAVAGHLQPGERLVLLFDPEKYLHKEAAAEWLHIAQALPAQVTVVFAQRREDILTSSTDFMVLSGVDRTPAHPLGFLSREESDDFLRELIRQRPVLADLGRPAREEEVKELCAELWARYAGFPLAMRIVADDLEATPAAPLQALRSLPAKLGDLFRGQYNRVLDSADSNGLRLVKALALQPLPIPLAILSTILDMSRDDVERLAARRELRVLQQSNPTGAVSLYHVLFREFVFDQLDVSERQAWHRESLDAYFPAQSKAILDRTALVASEYHLERSNLQTDCATDYARIARAIGDALWQLPDINLAENLTMAISCCNMALRVYTEASFPVQWATTQVALGIAYADLPTGDRAAHLAQAVACYEAALRVFTEQHSPADWAMVQNNLGLVYRNLPRGNRTANVTTAIAYFKGALRARTEHRAPVDWAKTQINLGVAYADLPTGDRGENLAGAIDCYKKGLRFLTEGSFPADWAGTQVNLGIAYHGLPTGDRAGNLAQAIICFEAALQVYTEYGFPVKWALTHHNAYSGPCRPPIPVDAGHPFR